MCCWWWHITTSGFVHHLENVQLPLCILCAVIFQSSTYKNITFCEVYVCASWAYNVDSRKPWHRYGRQKPEIITFLELWQIASKFQRQIRDFRWWRARYKIRQMIATTIDYQKLQDCRPKRLYCHFRLSAVVAIAQCQFLRAGRGRKRQICRWSCHPIIRSSRDGFGGHIAISGCRPLLQSLGDTLFGLAMVENLGLAVRISTLSVVIPVV